jgi:MYXO-CTERM domain-containing protein
VIRRLAVTAVVASAIALAPRRAEACSCAPPPGPVTALEQAEAVFVAEIASVVQQGHSKIVRARVKRAFKGVGVSAGKTVELRTGLGGGDCGIRFTAGSSWLVYATTATYGDPLAPSALYAGRCSRTTEIAYAADDIKELDAAKRGGAPSASPSASVSASSSPLPSSSASASAASSPSSSPSSSPPEPMVDAAVATPQPDAGREVPASASPAPGSKGCACDLASPEPRGGSSWIAVALAATLVAARRRRQIGSHVAAR